jgi:thiol peroxidase
MLPTAGSICNRKVAERASLARLRLGGEEVRAELLHWSTIMERPNAITLMGNPQTLVGPELKKGDSAPDFKVVDEKMQSVDLAKTGNAVRIFSVVPSLDTPVCDAQTKKFNEDVPGLNGVEVYTISMDLPFGQKRWSSAYGVDRVKMLSDHRDGSFGTNYGVLIKDVRLLARALFVIDKNNTIQHVEYVGEVANHPDYKSAIDVAKSLA